MDDEKEKEIRFEEDIDKLLSGKEVRTGEEIDDNYSSNIEFTKKVIECRGEPSAAFQEGLKRRLLAKLDEKEAFEKHRHSETVSFWDRLRNMIPQSPVWRTAYVTVTVTVVAIVVAWGTGLFSPGEEPIVTGPLPPTVSVEARASIAETTYSTGVDIEIRFTFKNITDEALSFAFPPEIRIGDLRTEVMRTFDAGQDTMMLASGQSKEYALTWDQKDDAVKQVSPGEYQIIIPNVQLGEGKGVLSLVESPVLTISSP